MSTVKIATEESKNTMQAWVLDNPTGVADLALKKIEVPEPGARDVRVRVAAVATNPCDVKHCSPPGKWFPPGAPYPAVIGSDCAGVVEAVGADVKRFKVGDRVQFFCFPFAVFGAFGEYAIQNELRVAKIPDAMDFATAATIPCAAWTAYETLFHRLRIEAGKSIFVAAGAGGVGTFAIQLAKHAGLKVVTTASGDNVERLKAEGYAVIDYKKDNFKDAVMAATGGRGVDYAIDVFGQQEAEQVFEAMAPLGNYCHLAEQVRSTQTSHWKGLMVGSHMVGAFTCTEEGTHELEKMAATINELVLEGKIKVPTIHSEFANLRDALQAQEKGHVRGKYSISLTQPPEAAQDAAYKFA